MLVRRLCACAAEGRTRKAANAVSRPSSLMPVTTREVERIAQEMAAHLAQQAALEESGGKTSHSLWLYTRKFVRLLLTKPVCNPPPPPSPLLSPPSPKRVLLDSGQTHVALCLRHRLTCGHCML